ncbi:MAG: hypothetical protein R3F56_10460 [Planctomycetota bacterium]
MSIRTIPLGLTAFVLATATAAQPHATCGTAVAADLDGLRFLDADGRELNRVAGSQLGLTTVPLGPCVIAVDGTGTRILDRSGGTLGAGAIANTGQRQTVVAGEGRVVVIDYDRARIFDNDRHRLGADIPRTGIARQSATVTRDLIVVIDDDKSRLFDRSGSPIGAPVFCTMMAASWSRLVEPSTSG